MIPSPWLSNCGRPARPNICSTSSMPISTNEPFFASYTCVPCGEWLQKRTQNYYELTIRINRLKMLVQFQLHMALDRVKRVFLLHRSISHLLLLSLACIFYYTRTCNEWEPCALQARVMLQYTWAVLWVTLVFTQVLTLIITAWAGRFTPQAKVAVQTRTRIKPRANSCSTIVRSCLNIPAWWMLNPSGNSSRSCLLRDFITCELIQEYFSAEELIKAIIVVNELNFSITLKEYFGPLQVDEVLQSVK